MNTPPSAATRRLALLRCMARRLLVAGAALLGVGSAQVEAAWRPASDQTFDVQLSQPFNLVRPVNSIALDLFGAEPDDIGNLRARGVATFCYIAAGFWEAWRPDARAFPATALGESVTGWPGQRWADLASPALAPILEARLDLCRERGFDGALLAGLDQPLQGSGFATTPEQRLAFQHRLAAATRARGLAAGAIGGIARQTDLVDAFDFLVADDCLAEDGCAEALAPWRASGKPAFLVAYTNQVGKMDRLCGEAATLGLQLIFKTQSLNGKLHRRCS